jgi:hypothetical protein
MDYTTWKSAADKVAFFSASGELKDLGSALELYEVRPSISRAEGVVSALAAWKGCAKFNAEQAKIGAGTVTQLETHVAGLTGGVIGNIKASQVRCTEGRLYRPGDAQYELDGDTVLPVNQCLPPLTPSEIQRLNEALRRTKNAIEAARDVMIGIAAKSTLGQAPYGRSDQLYIDYFGAFDQTRAKKVLKNYMQLHRAVCAAGGPILFDHRNTDFGEDCYAACKRGNVVADVKIWLGRAFFSEGIARGTDFKKVVSHTTDATVGTMVHEFSHGAIDTVDCPPVNNAGTGFVHSYDAVTWESDDNNIQASTPEDDKKLAAFEPRAAIVNADCYGQFAVGAANIMRGN